MRDVEHDVMYCNAGDPYITTIMYYNGGLMIGAWGDIAESCESRPDEDEDEDEDEPEDEDDQEDTDV